MNVNQGFIGEPSEIAGGKVHGFGESAAKQSRPEGFGCGKHGAHRRASPRSPSKALPSQKGIAKIQSFLEQETNVAIKTRSSEEPTELIFPGRESSVDMRRVG